MQREVKGSWEGFFGKYTSESTLEHYKATMTRFLKFIYGEGIDPVEACDRYLSEGRDYEEDIAKFFQTKLNVAPMSYIAMMSTVKTFLLENDVELKQKFWKGIRRMKRGSRAITADRVPEKGEIRRILMHLPINGKALALTLLSSGMRLGECVQLRLDDIDLESDPAKINIRAEYTKTGNRRWGFISTEAKEVIQEWLKVRGDYLVRAVGRSHKYGKSLEDDRLFPFDEVTFQVMWTRALDRAEANGRDKTTGIHEIHIHTLRKFFRTNHLADVDIREALMGHEGYLTEVYRKYSDKQLAEFYKRGESGVLVLTDVGEVEKLKQDIDEKNRQLQGLLQGLTAENMELKERIRKNEVGLDTVMRIVEEILPNIYTREEVEEMRQKMAK